MAKRILIAEDDYDLRSILTYFLSTRGYDVQSAQDGQQALDLMGSHTFDLVVLDMSMPEVDGWAVLRKLRAQSSTQSLPVIAFTAHVFASDAEKAIQAGCNG